MDSYGCSSTETSSGSTASMCLERLCLLIIVHTGAISLLYTNLQILAALGLLSTPLRPLTHLYWLLCCCATCIQHLRIACDLVLVFLHSASHLSGCNAIGMRNVKAHLHLCWCCNLVVANRTIENSYPSNSPQLFVPVYLRHEPEPLPINPKNVMCQHLSPKLQRKMQFCRDYSECWKNWNHNRIQHPLQKLEPLSTVILNLCLQNIEPLQNGKLCGIMVHLKILNR